MDADEFTLRMEEKDKNLKDLKDLRDLKHQKVIPEIERFDILTLLDAPLTPTSRCQILKSCFS